MTDQKNQNYESFDEEQGDISEKGGQAHQGDVPSQDSGNFEESDDSGGKGGEARRDSETNLSDEDIIEQEI